MSRKTSVSTTVSSADSFNQRRPTSQKRLLHSDSSVSYQISGLPSLPPFIYQRQQSDSIIRDVVSRAASHGGVDADLDATATSRSVVHGLILVTIMITS